ncbi:MAG: hypothetical protein SGCHY_001535 [Lobulomycetales sp.]
MLASPQDRLPTVPSTTKYPLTAYQLVKTIGTGTFGRVYLARNSITGAVRAMKVLKKSDVVRLKQVEHVINEKQILHTIKSLHGPQGHPFIVNLLDSYKDHRCLFMLEEFVPGGEIFSHLRRAGRFSNDISRFYIAEILLAIEYLHSLDIIYRDLKPENLLLDRTGHIKITDFGFAKRLPEGGRTWTLCGTPEYLAPEIIQSKGHGKAVDHWALGILCFEMLHGYPPFYDDTPFGIYEKILAGKITFSQSVDPYAKDLIKRLLTGDRTKRLGNLLNGIKDVKEHRWFRGVNWDALLARNISAPIIPKVGAPDDTRNFENYPELTEAEVKAYNSSESFDAEFLDF